MRRIVAAVVVWLITYSLFNAAESFADFTDFTDASSVEDTQLAWSSTGLKESHVTPTITNNNTNIIEHLSLFQKTHLHKYAYEKKFESLKRETTFLNFTLGCTFKLPKTVDMAPAPKSK